MQGYGPGKTPQGLMQIDAHGAGGNGFTARGPLWKKQNAVLSAMGLISLTSFLLRLIAKFKDRKISDTG